MGRYVLPQGCVAGLSGGVDGARSRPCGLPPVDVSLTTLPVLSRCEVEPVRGTYSPEGLALSLRVRLRVASRPEGLSLRLVVPVAVVLFALGAGALPLLPDCAPVAWASAAPLPSAMNVTAAAQNARAEYGVPIIVCSGEVSTSVPPTQLARPCPRFPYLPAASRRACSSAVTMSR